MPEPFSTTAARKIDHLERKVRDFYRLQRGYTLSDVFSAFQMLPGLRGFWPYSSINEAGTAYDQSNQGRHLTNNNASPRAFLANGMPYFTLNGTNQYWSRADEAGLDITGQLTFGGWFLPTTRNAYISKLAASGNYSYMLDTDNNKARLIVSSTGANAPQVVSVADISTTNWNFIVGRFTPSTEQTVFLNNVKSSVTVGVVASIFNSAAILAVGARSTPGSYSAGFGALIFICAVAISDYLEDRLFQVSRAFFGV